MKEQKGCWNCGKRSTECMKWPLTPGETRHATCWVPESRAKKLTAGKHIKSDTRRGWRWVEDLTPEDLTPEDIEFTEETMRKAHRAAERVAWMLRIPARRADKMQAAREALTAADRADAICRALAHQLRQRALIPGAEELLEGVRLPETPESGRHLREPPTLESIMDWNDAIEGVREQIIEALRNWNDAIEGVREQIIEAMRKQKEEKEMQKKPARETTIVTTLTVTNILHNATDEDGTRIRSGMTAQTWAETIAAHLMEDAYISPDDARVESVQVFTRTDKAPEEREAERPKVIAVDFDGTLCENAWPEIGAPKEGTIAYCKAARRAGCKLILWTNRADARLREAVRWCNAHGLYFDEINENLPEVIEAFGGDTRKIVADVYIDDKAKMAQDVESAWSEFSTIRDAISGRAE